MLVLFNQTTHLKGRIYYKGQKYNVEKEVLDACYPCCTACLDQPVDIGEKIPAVFNIDKRVIYPIDGYGRLNRFLDSCVIPNAETDLLLVCSTPYIFGVLPQWLLEKSRVVLLTMFEGTPLPKHWIEPMRKGAVAIITPSTFCKKLYQREKALKNTPIYVVPLYTKRFVNLKPKREDIFYFGMENAFIQGKQKGWDLIIRAFEELNLPNAKLILKSRNSHYAYNDHEWMDRARKNPNIEVILADFTDDEMVFKFYNRLDCFVFPSRGEGFGLPPLQAMGMGIPTILTNGHGMKDFAKYGIPVKVKHKKYPSYYVNRVIDSTSGIMWQEPDFEDLKKRMQYVYMNFEQEKQRAVEQIPLLQKKYSPQAFVAGLNRAVTHYEKNYANSVDSRL